MPTAMLVQFIREIHSIYTYVDVRKYNIVHTCLATAMLVQYIRTEIEYIH